MGVFSSTPEAFFAALYIAVTLATVQQLYWIIARVSGMTLHLSQRLMHIYGAHCPAQYGNDVEKRSESDCALDIPVLLLFKQINTCRPPAGRTPPSQHGSCHYDESPFDSPVRSVFLLHCSK